MKLCHVVPSLEEQHGGPSKSVRALCAALARIGHGVDLFATEHRAATEIFTDGDGLRTSMFPRDQPDRICPSRALNAALNASDAGIIHHHALWLRTLHYAHRSARRRSAKLVVSPRGMTGSWAWRHHRWRKRLANWFIHPGALAAIDGWHATSSEEADDIRARGFTQPVCVAPNGVSAPESADRAAAIAHWQEACPETATRPVALFYSRFHSKKRVIELIDLWLERAPPEWLLLLVGIPQEYSAETLEHYVLKNSGQGRVRVFNGLGRPAPYAVASLFLLPSHNENFGLVVAEAMASGVPALVTDSTPWREIARREIGWCVPWADYGEALAAALAESPTQRRARGDRARTWVVNEFSWERSARQLGEFYATLRPGS